METSKVSKFDKRYITLSELSLPKTITISGIHRFELSVSSENFDTKPVTISYVGKYGKSDHLFGVEFSSYFVSIKAFSFASTHTKFSHLIDFINKNASFEDVQNFNRSIIALCIREANFIDAAKAKNMKVDKYVEFLEKEEAKKIKDAQRQLKAEIELCKKFIKKFGKLYLYEERQYTGSKRHKKFVGVDISLSTSKTRHKVCFLIGEQSVEWLQKHYMKFVSEKMKQ